MKNYIAVVIFISLLVGVGSAQTSDPVLKREKGNPLPILSCTNGGRLTFVGDVRVTFTVKTCDNTTCSTINPEELAINPHGGYGEGVSILCSTAATDAKASKMTNAAIDECVAEGYNPNTQAMWDCVTEKNKQKVRGGLK